MLTCRQLSSSEVSEGRPGGGGGGEARHAANSLLSGRPCCPPAAERGLACCQLAGQALPLNCPLRLPACLPPPASAPAALGLGKLRLAIPEWCEPDWRALMESCWVEDPNLRPTCRCALPRCPFAQHCTAPLLSLPSAACPGCCCSAQHSTAPPACAVPAGMPAECVLRAVLTPAAAPAACLACARLPCYRQLATHLERIRDMAAA